MKKIALILISFLIQSSTFGQTETEINSLLEAIAKTSNSKDISKTKEFKSIAKYNKKVLPILGTFFMKSDATLTFSECANRQLTKGEIAIIVADQIKRMPYAMLTGIQNCLATFCDKNPNLIEYYLEHIKQNGNLIFVKNYNDWLKSKDFRKS